ncbi:MAG: hypothetical protein PHH73_00215 [Candidatus Rickettsiella isopodorum]|nr:hypothetical protein [Candidatus Rickettsiella isopodorum]
MELGQIKHLSTIKANLYLMRKYKNFDGLSCLVSKYLTTKEEWKEYSKFFKYEERG